MLDEKKINEVKRRVNNYTGEEIIKKEKANKKFTGFPRESQEKDKLFTEFFLKNAKDSLESSKLLFEVSTNNKLKTETGFPDFNGFLWVINSSYYSMFYMARALLESEGIKIKTDLSVHMVVFDVFVYYFYLTGKLQKKIIEDFVEAKEEADEIQGRARGLVEDYFYEKNKRATFTYEIGVIAMQNKAQTSLERAKKFNEEIRKMIEV